MPHPQISDTSLQKGPDATQLVVSKQSALAELQVPSRAATGIPARLMQQLERCIRLRLIGQERDSKFTATRGQSNDLTTKHTAQAAVENKNGGLLHPGSLLRTRCTHNTRAGAGHKTNTQAVHQGSRPTPLHVQHNRRRPASPEHIAQRAARHRACTQCHLAAHIYLPTHLHTACCTTMTTCSRNLHCWHHPSAPGCAAPAGSTLPCF